MKPKPEESKCKAFIKPEYLAGRLPEANPFGFAIKASLPARNTKEYRAATRMVNDFLSRPHKGTPLVGSKIAF